MATAQKQPRSVTLPAASVSELERASADDQPMLLVISGEMNDRIEELMHRTGYDRGELFDIAIACFKMGLDAVEDGHRVGVVDDDRDLSVEFSGFHKNDPTAE